MDSAGKAADDAVPSRSRDDSHADPVPGPTTRSGGHRPAASHAAALSLQRTAGNRALVSMLARTPTRSALQRIPDPNVSVTITFAGQTYWGPLDQILASARDLMLELRDYIETGNESYQRFVEDQRVVRWVSDIFAAQWVPPADIWDRARSALAGARRWEQLRDPVHLGPALTNAITVYEQVRWQWDSYRNNTAEGAARTVWVLHGVEVAGAVAATVVSGGLASGAGVVGVAAASGAGAGAYEIAQSSARQRAQVYEHQRNSVNWREIIEQGGATAVTTFVGALIGGRLTQRFTRALGPLLAEYSPAAARILGTQGQRLLAELLGGTLSVPFSAAVSQAIQALRGHPLTADQFVHEVLREMVSGGVLQLFIGAITHGRTTPATESGLTAPGERQAIVPGERTGPPIVARPAVVTRPVEPAPAATVRGTGSAGPDHPSGAADHPTDPSGTQVRDPDDSRNTDTDPSRTTDPDDSRATDPDDSRPTDPENSRPTRPIDRSLVGALRTAEDALALLQLRIERALAGSAEGRAALRRLINPLRLRQNCLSCTRAVEGWFRGNPTTATRLGTRDYATRDSEPSWDLSDLENEFGGRFRLGDPDEAAAAVLRAGSSSRAILMVGWHGESTGHVVNIVNIGGEVLFIDGQVGTVTPTFQGPVIAEPRFLMTATGGTPHGATPLGPVPAGAPLPSIEVAPGRQVFPGRDTEPSPATDAGASDEPTGIGSAGAQERAATEAATARLESASTYLERQIHDAAHWPDGMSEAQVRTRVAEAVGRARAEAQAVRGGSGSRLFAQQVPHLGAGIREYLARRLDARITAAGAAAEAAINARAQTVEVVPGPPGTVDRGHAQSGILGGGD